MSYNKTAWVDGQSPDIDADNLGNMETGIEDAHIHGNIIGVSVDPGNVSGAVVFDLEAGEYEEAKTAVGNITSISFSNKPAEEPWSLLVEAVNWGAYTVTLGSIRVSGGALSLTTSGTDYLLFYGQGSTENVKLADSDMQ
jgi:hypothetical protein